MDDNNEFDSNIPLSTINRDFASQQHKSYSEVGSKKSSNTKLLVGSVGGVAIVLVLYFMIFGGAAKHPLNTSTQSGSSSNNQVLTQNEQKLKTLQGQSQQLQATASSIQSGLSAAQSSSQGDATDKAQLVRLNAPSTIYSGSSSGADTSTTSQASNTTLSAGDAYSGFANSQNSSVDTVEATKIAHPDYTVAQGEFIHATLETAIDSDLPGMVRAVVTDPVYSYTGDQPLIPAGSRLIGQYATAAGNGGATNRLFVIWNRIITPTGLSVMINSPGSDQLGQAGQGADAVESHFGQIFGNAFLLSIIGAGTANYNVSSTDQPNSADAYRQAIAGSLQQTAGQVLGQNMSIKPTLHVYQGAAINVFVSKDLDLSSALGGN